MERRDFIKCGACALSSLLLCACSRNDKAEENDKKYPILHVEIPVCYHCNLNCAYCDHFAPLAPKYEMPVEVFEKDIKQLSQITDKKLKHMYLIGGEPLLHKNIEDLVRIARENFPFTNIAIFTNGLLLNEMKESFWKTCGQYKVDIVYSHYWLASNYPKNFNLANANAKKYNVSLKKEVDVYKFRKTQLSLKPIYDKEKNYKCPAYLSCVTLDNGKLYSCAIQGGLKFLNNYFKDKQIHIPQKDILDIYKIHSSKDIWKYLTRPKSLCAHCGCFVNLKEEKWQPSQRLASEWYAS